MTRLAWLGIAALWIAASVATPLILAKAGGGETVTSVRYTFVALVSDHTAGLLADPPSRPEIALTFVDTPEEVVAALADPAIAGVILDSTTAGSVPLDALTDAYRESKVMAAFEIRPTQVLGGACVNAPPPCEGDTAAALHEDEPAIAYSFRAGPSARGEAETVVHPYRPATFFGTLLLRTQTVMGIPHVPESPSGSR